MEDRERGSLRPSQLQVLVVILASDIWEVPLGVPLLFHHLEHPHLRLDFPSMTAEVSKEVLVASLLSQVHHHHHLA